MRKFILTLNSLLSTWDELCDVLDDKTESFTYDATLEPYLGVYNADIDFISHVSDKHFDKLANGWWNS